MDLAHAGLFVDSEFSAWFPFEVLDGIGDINFAPIDLKEAESEAEGTL